MNRAKYTKYLKNIIKYNNNCKKINKKTKNGVDK